MFPNGWPGVALLLLRLAAGMLLVYDGTVALMSGAHLEMTIVQSVAIASGILLVVGFWTPIAGSLVFFVELLFVFLGTTQIETNVLLGVLGVALAVLGPGHRSLDALCYGRKRFVIRH